MDPQEPTMRPRRPADIPERRDYTPKGRIRRILHEYRAASLVLMLGVLVAAGLFVATSAWAVNERLFRVNAIKLAPSRDDANVLTMQLTVMGLMG